MKLLRNKRIMVFLTMILAFAIACIPHILSGLTFASDTADPAVIGSASLTDSGDTVFIRLARNEEECCYWTGYTVGNMGPEDDPLKNVDINVLRPITSDDPLIGTIDKDIYIFGAGKAEVFVDDLVLTEGHKIYVETAYGVDIKMGKLTVSGIEGSRPFNIGDKAEVIVNGDAYCSKVELFRPDDPAYAFFHPSQYNPEALSGKLTVNGNLIGDNTDIIAANYVPASITVTGDITGFTSTYANFMGQISADGKLEGGSINVNNGASLSAGQDLICTDIWVTGTAVSGSSITVAGNLSDSGDAYFNQTTLNVGGSFKAENGYIYFQNMQEPVSIGAALPEGSMAVKAAGNFTVNRSIVNVYGSFESSFVEVLGKAFITAGDTTVNGPVLLTDGYENVTNGAKFSSLKAKGYVNVLKHSELTVDGDFSSDSYVLFTGNTNIGGSLTTTSDFSILNDTEVTVGEDLNCGSWMIIVSNGTLNVGGGITANNYIGVYFSSTVTAGDDVISKNNTVYCLSSSILKTEGSISTGTSSCLECLGGSEVEVGGDVKAYQMHVSGLNSSGKKSNMTVAGGIDTTWLNIYSGNLSVNEDLVVNIPYEGYSNGSLTIGGDFINKDNETIGNGITFNSNMTLKVGGNIEFGLTMLDLRGDSSQYEIAGYINAMRITDILMDEAGTDTYGSTLYRPLETVAPFRYAESGSERSSRLYYTQPYRQQYILLKDGEGNLYYADIRDWSKRVFNVQPAVVNNVTYELGSLASQIPERDRIIAAHSIKGFENTLLDELNFVINDPKTYFFLGWNTKENGTGIMYETGTAVNFEQDTTLYAQYGKFVQSISIETPEVSVMRDHEVALTAFIDPIDAYNQAVTWSSADESIAKVDKNGVVTGITMGTTEITVTTVDGGKTATCKVTVEDKNTRKVTISVKDRTYGDEAGTPSVMGLDVQNPVFKYEYKSVDGSVYNSEVPVQAGKYNARVVFGETFDYNAGEAVCVFEILPKEISLKWTDTEFIYDGTAHVPTAVAEGLIKDDVCNVTVEVSEAAVDAGSYTAKATALSNANYKLPAVATAEFDILPKEISLKWQDTEFVYNGAVYVPTAVAEGLIKDDVCNVTVEVSEAAVDAGRYTVKATALSDANYKLPAVTTTEYTIEKAEAVITIVSSADKDLVYNGKEIELISAENVKSEGGKPVFALVTEDTAVGEEQYSETVPVGKDAGVYTVYVKVEGDKNHKSSAAKKLSIVINKAEAPAIMPESRMTVDVNTEYITAVKLPDGWKWADEENGKTLESGKEIAAKAIYIAEDAKNYETVSIEIKVIRNNPAVIYVVTDDNRPATTEGNTPTAPEENKPATTEENKLVSDKEEEQEAVTVENEDGSVTEKTVTVNTDGSTTTIENTTKADGSVTSREENKKANGEGSATIITSDAEGNILSKTEESTTVSKKGTVTVTSVTENADGSTVNSTVKTSKTGKVVTETVETETDGSSITIKETVNTDKTGNVNITSKTVEKDTQGQVQSTITETIIIDTKGNTAITAKIVNANGSKTQESFTVSKKGDVKMSSLETDQKVVTIPENVEINGESYPVTVIGKDTMKGNKKITSVTIGENITTIGKDAFRGAKKLASIELTDSITRISKNAFKGIAKNAVFKIVATTKEEFDRVVTLIKASGVKKSVKFEMVTAE